MAPVLVWLLGVAAPLPSTPLPGFPAGELCAADPDAGDGDLGEVATPRDIDCVAALPPPPLALTLPEVGGGACDGLWFRPGGLERPTTRLARASRSRSGRSLQLWSGPPARGEGSVPALGQSEPAIPGGTLTLPPPPFTLRPPPAAMAASGLGWSVRLDRPPRA